MQRCRSRSTRAGFWRVRLCIFFQSRSSSLLFFSPRPDRPAFYSTAPDLQRHLLRCVLTGDPTLLPSLSLAAMPRGRPRGVPPTGRGRRRHRNARSHGVAERSGEQASRFVVLLGLPTGGTNQGPSRVAHELEETTWTPLSTARSSIRPAPPICHRSEASRSCRRPSGRAASPSTSSTPAFRSSRRRHQS